ncbi:hypothetical protein NP511_13765 [Natrinema thermotolerans]|uniref:Uncharacterized protein n=1 Tax=Natrinema thermotolerans TaxID=121872 RepID=A0AAF0SXU0_9EURY|nr:hypothetical protein [Natrinema thermotolerans]ELZ08090.1 hypothetical protein C478_18752 [Natrinema thermotolerans DSM 11552]QCC59478.1 hypothetical protein DVR14_12895 [Natrinema thermotolerans]WMT06451.1 hypothetical protein NP511_13765 [Natrinema thermotolerans]
MVSSDGLKTWFDYQLLFLGLAITVVIATVVWNRLMSYLRTLLLAAPEFDPAAPQFALAVTGAGILVISLLVVLTGLLNRERP